MMTSKNKTAKLFTAVGAAIVAACIIGMHQAPGPQLGTPPHCAYGEAHAQGLPPQCAMPHPVNASNVP